MEQLKALNIEGMSPSGKYNKDDLIAYILSLHTDASDPASVIAHMNAMESRMQENFDNLREENATLKLEIATERERITTLSKTVDKLIATTSSQQRYLERLDGKERIQNIIIIGVPESDEQGDKVKMKEIRDAICPGSSFTPHHKRLGQARQSGSRPILWILPNDVKRKDVLDKAALLGNSAPLDGMKLKKDQHPALRKEWRRLFVSEETEKKKPENVGATIALDRVNRTLTRDGVVIDRFCANF